MLFKANNLLFVDLRTLNPLNFYRAALMIVLLIPTKLFRCFIELISRRKVKISRQIFMKLTDE